MIKELLKLKSEEVNQILEAYFPKSGAYDSELLEAMHYSLSAGGKRLRPIFIQSFCKLFGGDAHLAEPFMVGMEMLHTYSLVHDDLPAIDNDDYRRGMLTTHKKYGEALAILTGDGLLHESYEIIIEAMMNQTSEDQKKMLTALQIFTEKTGIHGMHGGQTADVIHTNEMMPDDLLDYVYRKKTGALIEGSMMIGAALGGASTKELAVVEEIGANVGLAFQIQDDLLDAFGDEQELGKPIHSDEKNGKKTYLTIHGIEESQKDVVRLSNRAKELLSTCGVDAKERVFLADLIEYLIKRVN